MLFFAPRMRYNHSERKRTKIKTRTSARTKKRARTRTWTRNDLEEEERRKGGGREEGLRREGRRRTEKKREGTKAWGRDQRDGGTTSEGRFGRESCTTENVNTYFLSRNDSDVQRSLIIAQEG